MKRFKDFTYENNHYPFKLGDEVVIKTSSKYIIQQPFKNNRKIVGVIIEIKGVNRNGNMDTKVEFQNGYSNAYNFKDLELYDDFEESDHEEWVEEKRIIKYEEFENI